MSAAAGVELPVLELAGVGKVFPRRPRRCSIGISIAVAHGELVALIGPSGCGKSTVLNIVAGLIEVRTATCASAIPACGSPTCSSGRACCRGGTWRERRLRPRADELSREARRDAVRAAIARVNLEGHEHKYPHELSGGMQQRVAIARGLAVNPRLLLLDEPFGALDALTRSYMQEELLAIVRGAGTTAILVTHDIDEALLLADRILVMSSRPGTIKHELRVPFGPARSLDSLLRDPEYARIRTMLRELLRPEVVEELHA